MAFCGQRSDPEALFALADLSVLTSAREGLPRVAVQSLAAGCPMVVQELPGIDEIINHGRNGVIAEGHNMEVAVRPMLALQQNQRRLTDLRQGALATDVGAWALDALGQRTTQLYGLPVRRASNIADEPEMGLA